jgi:glycosyltransferase involved in cell wall biosynthesis
VTQQTLQRTEFYRQDFEILASLGHEVGFLSNPLGLKGDVDLAYVWWWNYLWAWGAIAKMRGLPVLTTGVFDVAAFGRMPLYKRALKKWGVRFSDLNVVLSKDEEEILPSVVGSQLGPIRYSPLAIDSSVYKPPEGRLRDRHVFTIVNIAWQRMANIKRKMIPELLEAFALLSRERKNVRLILAGPPEDGGPFLRKRASELGVESSVEFPGEISREKKVELLQNCSLYCQVSRYEGFGLATGEALACGAPVLASSVGAVPEVIGECGTYARELSVEGILDGLKRCMDDQDRMESLAAAGVRRIRDLFSVERRRAELDKFIRELT